jgi:histidine triad (HIT) family protein
MQLKEDCLFCKIVTGKIPATKVFENDFVIGFKDIAPQAPIHYLFIPKIHIESMADVNAENRNYFHHVMDAVVATAQKEQIANTGYRTVLNTQKLGGQTVFHLHAHLLGGTQMGGGMTGAR